ncbi:MAG: hypothetical protein M1828_000846 [Chrysothrix sp. TS-e1954]|nr:MAG: hypothetical protein M1828_000846 [Chrysothrix sp. TS-e1954]
MSSNHPISRPLHDKSATATSSTLLQPRETGQTAPTSANDVATITQRPSPVAKSWAHFVAGAVGGATSTILTSPLDVLKTRLQSDFYQSQLANARNARGIPPLHTLSLPRSSAIHIRETFQILFAVPRVEGWRALFKGLGPNLVGVVPARSINFFTYGNGKRLISQNFNDGREASWVHLLAAANAGMVTGTATCPIWVIKTRLQLDKNTAGTVSLRRYRNAADCFAQTLRHEGIRGLYRGLGASYLGVTESTLQWVLYERMKMGLDRREERVQLSQKPRRWWDDIARPVGVPLSAGAAKLVAALATYPHEVVRTRLRQAPMENGLMKYTGIIQCFRLTFHQEGMAGLYGGLVPHMLRVVPSAIIMFGCYEAVLKLLGTSSGV